MKILLISAALLLMLAGCITPSPTPDPSPTGSAPADTLILQTTTDNTYGIYVVDGPGRSVYVYVDDKGENSECDTLCPDPYFPVMSEDNIVGQESVDENLIGVNGQGQVMYSGHPLYYYSGDTLPNPVPNGVSASFFLISPNGFIIGVS